jgi:hypothetical protein
MWVVKKSRESNRQLNELHLCRWKAVTGRAAVLRIQLCQETNSSESWNTYRQGSALPPGAKPSAVIDFLLPQS